MPLGFLNNLSLVNRDHFLANGLLSWYLALPQFASGRLWPDLGVLAVQNTGVFNGNAAWSISQRPGGFGAATVYDGTNSFVDATVNQLPAGVGVPLTIAFWCYSNNLTGFRTPYFYGNNSAGLGVLFAQDGTSNDGTIDVGVVGSNFISSTKKLAVGVWTHLCLTYDGTTARLYFNGVQDSSAAVSLNPHEVFSRIGSYIGSQFWSGGVDDVRIYWRGMGASEVKELYDNSTQGYPGLLNFVQPQLLVAIATLAPPSTFMTPAFTAGPPMPGVPWFHNTALQLAGAPSQSSSGQAAMSNVPILTPFTVGPPKPGTPWFRNTPPQPYLQRPTAPLVTIPTVLPGFTAGPPIMGAPWIMASGGARGLPGLQPPLTPPPPPPPVGTPSTTPFTAASPPIPGAPWFVIPQAPSGAPGGNPPTPPPSHGAGGNLTLLQRDPTQEQPLRRFTEILADAFNSLVGQGILVQKGPATWTITGTGAGSGLTGNFP